MRNLYEVRSKAGELCPDQIEKLVLYDFKKEPSEFEQWIGDACLKRGQNRERGDRGDEALQNFIPRKALAMLRPDGPPFDSHGASARGSRINNQ